jgi:hypothetical protein
MLQMHVKLNKACSYCITDATFHQLTNNLKSRELDFCSFDNKCIIDIQQECIYNNLKSSTSIGCAISYRYIPLRHNYGQLWPTMVIYWHIVACILYTMYVVSYVISKDFQLGQYIIPWPLV